MEQNSTLSILGGTGKSGSYVVKRLLTNGFRLRLLHRYPDTLSIAHPGVKVIKGDARDPDAIDRLLSGASGVVSTLGQPKGEPSIFSTATKNILAAMHQHDISRYIVTTGLNVDTPQDEKGEKSRIATRWMKEHFPETTFDKQKEYEMLVASDANWTLIRLPLIEQTDFSFKTMVSLLDCPGEKISATDLAAFIFDQLSDKTYLRRAPFLANG